MQEIRQIIKTLKKGEVRFVRKFYKVHGDSEAKKRLDLFNLVISNKVSTDLDAAAHLYNSKPNSAFSHLKTRLKEDVLNVILLQDTSKKFESQASQAEFDCKRLYIKGDLLLSRGAHLPGIKLLKKAAKLADKFKLTINQVLIEDLLRDHLGSVNGISHYKKYQKNIHENIRLYEQEIKAKEYFNHLILPNLFSVNKSEGSGGFGVGVINKLHNLYRSTGSAMIHYWFLRTASNYYLISKNYQKALGYVDELINLLDKEPTVDSASKRAEAYLLSAYILVYLKQHHKAIEQIEKARNSSKANLLKDLNSIELLFYAYMHLREYRKADEALKRGIKHPGNDMNEFYKAKWIYYKANLQFAQTNYLQSIATLNPSTVLLKDKAGWLIGYKMLEILNFIEMKNYDFVDYRLDNLRKLLQRLKEQDLTRIKSIFHILDQLSKHNYNYEKVRKKNEGRIKLLAQNTKDYGRDMFGYEIICFEDWLNAKRDYVVFPSFD